MGAGEGAVAVALTPVSAPALKWRPDSRPKITHAPGEEARPPPASSSVIHALYRSGEHLGELQKSIDGRRGPNFGVFSVADFKQARSWCTLRVFVLAALAQQLTKKSRAKKNRKAECLGDDEVSLCTACSMTVTKGNFSNHVKGRCDGVIKEGLVPVPHGGGAGTLDRCVDGATSLGSAATTDAEFGTRTKR